MPLRRRLRQGSVLNRCTCTAYPTRVCTSAFPPSAVSSLRSWAEPHQYSDFGTEFMIYAPRMLSELDIVLSFIKESLSFARGTTPAR